MQLDFPEKSFLPDMDPDTFNGIKRGENTDRFLLLHEIDSFRIPVPLLQLTEFY